MKGKTMKSGLICIFAGILFFFNPSFNMFDILPDFIGCILIVCGLAEYSRLDENLSSAKKCAVYYGWISAIKLVFSVWTNMGHSDYLLSFTFIFGVLDIICMLALFTNLYTGFDYFSMRHECESLRPSASNAFSMSVIFAFVTRILDFAPQILELIRQKDELDLSYNAYRKMPMSALKPYITAAALAINLILGILLIIMTAKFFFKAAKDQRFISSAKEKYNSDILSDKGLYVSLIMPGVYTFMYIGFAFLYDFSIDAVNLLPSFIGTLLFLAAFLRLRKLDTTLKVPYIPFIISLLSNTIGYFYMTKVNLGINYLFQTQSFNEKEFPLLQSTSSIAVTAIIGAISLISTLWLVFAVYSAMKKVFLDNLRSVGTKKLIICKINAVILCVLGFVYSCMRTVMGYLSTDAQVNTFITTRAVINSQDQLSDMLKYPLVRAFDKLDSASVIVSVVFFAAMVWNILYLTKVSYATEGNKTA